MAVSLNEKPFQFPLATKTFFDTVQCNKNDTCCMKTSYKYKQRWKPTRFQFAVQETTTFEHKTHSILELSAWLGQTLALDSWVQQYLEQCLYHSDHLVVLSALALSSRTDVNTFWMFSVTKRLRDCTSVLGSVLADLQNDIFDWVNSCTV